ncbi:MAG: helix-turn-helix transcriptional regulator [Paludibacteraceae bacterium]|nr:helix-turn-helix transcriptional regulator [Paludibacteraceae bacterium]
MKAKEKNIPLLDCPMDYLVGDASGKLLNEYGKFPCKILCGTYAFMVRGHASATIDIDKYEFHENDFLYLKPGSFLLIDNFSDDALVYYILFSSAFLEKNAFNTRLRLDTLSSSEPVIHLSKEHADTYRSMIEVLLKALNCRPSLLTTQKMLYVFNILQISYLENLQGKPADVQDRKTEIYQQYSKLVLDHYAEWHHVVQYADSMRITLPHLCSTIKQVSGRTAGDLITDALLTDAKSQLKLTNLQIKEIAMSLGFDNVAFFNRFFKSHTGMTPKAYRNA